MKLRYDRNSEHGRRALSQLAGGYYGVLWGILGDLDYMNKALDLPLGLVPFAAAKALAHYRGQISELALDGGMFNGLPMNGNYGKVAPNAPCLRIRISRHGSCPWIGCTQSIWVMTNKHTGACYP